MGQGVDLNRRLQFEYLRVDEITPYEYNPRDNTHAIPIVANSIRSFGFLIPVVIDADNVLVAGHTRWGAARLIGMDAIPCVRADHLTAAQINAFRVIDNKVAEVAEWNHDMLAGEISRLTEMGLAIDFTNFGWSQSDIDCLSEVVADTCLDAPIVTSEGDIQRTSERRAPIQTRVVIGELVFFLPAAQYRTWVEGIRQLCQFDEAAIVAELKRRLSMPAS
jgi:ParB-like chromosome segregation protein Spo0J